MLDDETSPEYVSSHKKTQITTPNSNNDNKMGFESFEPTAGQNFSHGDRSYFRSKNENYLTPV